MVGAMNPGENDLEVGREALRRGAWEDARATFAAAAHREETPEALEGLGQAAWWLDDPEATFNARERAYALFQKRGDKRNAARMAITISWDHLTFFAARSVSNGWLQRARRHLSELEECSETGWMLVRLAHDAMGGEGGLAKARRLCSDALALARRLGDIDLEMVALSEDGIAQVLEGRVAAGMEALDEVAAAVVAGELTDWAAIIQASCNLVKGCERVRDYGRAAEWCKRLQDYSAKMRLNSMFAVCRTQYAEILMWHGEWGNAEAELVSARREIETTRPGNLGSSLARLAKLRVRQGRLEEAHALLVQLGQDMRSELVRAELALERGAADEAEEHARKVLRRVSPENRIDAGAALEVLVRALTANKSLAPARDALAQLQVVVREVGTPPLAASYSLSAGLVSRATRDLEAAKQHFEDAADLYRECGAPFEEGRSRLELAQSLEAVGRRDLALREARAAHLCLYRVGAKTHAARALAVVDGLSRKGEAASASYPASNLTRREHEVLRLVAQGMTNSQIGRQLFISSHTVHRHVANILTKLDLPSRAAAAAHAVAQRLV